MDDKLKKDPVTTMVDTLSQALEHAIKKSKFELDGDVTVSTLLREVSFTLVLDSGKGLKYDDLDWVAKTFKTDKINIRTEEREMPLSEVTWETVGVVLLDVKGASIPEMPPPPTPSEYILPGGYIIVAGGPVLASAWARGRQCKKDEAFFYSVDDDIDHLPRKQYKIAYVGPQSKKKDDQVAHLKELGFGLLEES
jgi:hypothetical protein